MARIRSIKPEFWTSEKIVECDPITRLFFVGLWTFADDAGIARGNPKRLKMQIFPADDVDSTSIRRMIDELSSNGLICSYIVGNSEYLLINGWKEHQKIDRPTYRLPFPNGQIPKDKDEYRRLLDEFSTSPHPRIGREGIGEERSIPNQEKEVLVTRGYTREGEF